MKVLIVEDSRLARLELKELLKQHPELQLVGEAADVDAAFTLITELQPDLLLLDIDLAGATAFDLLAKLLFIPKIIFTTAYAEHALAAFDYPTLDYLLKPVTASRFGQADFVCGTTRKSTIGRSYNSNCRTYAGWQQQLFC